MYFGYAIRNVNDGERYNWAEKKWVNDAQTYGVITYNDGEILEIVETEKFDYVEIVKIYRQ